nr:retrovirus-related Pol polyprotein from transposon TNT 1-94 [Tanacetum cinerariifolium]
MAREGYKSHTLEGSGSDEVRYSFQDTKSHQVFQSRDITFVDSIYGARSSDTSEGSENSRSFEDSGRLDEEYSEDGASFKEGGSKTLHVRRSNTKSRAPKKAINEEMVSLEKNKMCSLVRILAGKKASQRLWMFKVKEDQNNRKMYKARLVVKGFQQKWGLDYHEIFSSVMKMTTISDVHQVGDEREVEVLRSFNWPPIELTTKDGLLPDRDRVQRVLYVRRYRKVRAVALLKGSVFCMFGGTKRLGTSVVEGKVVQSLQRLLEMESSEVISLQVCIEVCAGVVYPNSELQCHCGVVLSAGPGLSEVATTTPFALRVVVELWLIK